MINFGGNELKILYVDDEILVLIYFGCVIGLFVLVVIVILVEEGKCMFD